MRFVSRWSAAIAIAALGTATVGVSGIGAATHATKGSPNLAAGAPLPFMEIAGPPLPTIGNEDAGIVAAVNDINAHGGVDGHPLKEIHCTAGAAFGGDPNSTATCASEAVSDHVLALIQLVTDYEGNVYPQIDKANIPNIGPIALDPALDDTNAMSFQVFPGPPATTAGSGELEGVAGCKLSAYLATSNTPQLSDAEAAFAAGVLYSGHKVSAPVSVASTETDAAPTVALLESRGVTCVDDALISGAGITLDGLLTAIKDSGKSLNVEVNETALSQSAISALGPIANGVIANGFFLPQAEHTADETTIQNSISKYGPKGTPLSSFHWLPWEDTYYFAQLAKKVIAAGLPMTSKDILKEIPSTPMSYGISPTIAFDKPGPIAGAPKAVQHEHLLREGH